MELFGNSGSSVQTTARTRFSGGIVVNIDPSLKIPAFLIFSYWHRFENQLELNFTLPSSAGLRREFSDRFWMTLGTSLGVSLAFFDSNNTNLPKDANYTIIDLKSGIGTEYRGGKKNFWN